MCRWTTRITATVASALWMLAFTLLAVATVLHLDSALAHWALFAAIVASVATAWCCLVYERTRVETIAALLAQAEESEGLRSVSRR